MVDKQEAKGFGGTSDEACQILWNDRLDLWSVGVESLASDFVHFGFDAPLNCQHWSVAQYT